MSRGQSHVVGVALLLGLTVVALGGLTVTVGSVMDEQAASTDAARIAGEMETALQPVQATGRHMGRLHFSGGNLHTAERDIRVLRNGSTVATREASALLFEAADRRVAFVAGAVIRGTRESAWRVTDPPITSASRNGILVVGVPTLGVDDVAVAGTGATTVALQTTVSHHRTALGNGQFAVAIETKTPGPYERFARSQNASVSRIDFDNDGISSVVATYPERRKAYLVTHNLSLEIENG